MAEKVKKSIRKNILLSENTIVIKEEFQDNDYLDDKICTSKTPIIEAIDGCADGARHNEIKHNEMPTVDIKIEPLSEICNNRKNDNVKKEDGIFSAKDIKTEFNSGFSFCNHCQEIYQDYCTKCEMLVHILNRNTLGNTCNGENKEIPKEILETKELFGHLGVFALKVIPSGVKFGPFTGLNTSGCSWRLKDGRFVVDKDKTTFLNWMQYVNPARSISEQNLLAFQCDSHLYYRSICEIRVNEELLVYFGEEYNQSLSKDIEVGFSPTIEENRKDVFACTFCCLGFSSKAYLKEHKIICPVKINGEFSVEDLTQCPFCKIYLDKKEYIDSHMTYCSERTNRNCVTLTRNNQTVEVKKGRPQLRRTYKCKHCKYKTVYKGDLKSHKNKNHCEVKKFKCGICNRLFRMKRCLKMHVKNIHVDVEKKEAQKWFIEVKRSKATPVAHGSQEVKQFGCSKCEFRTKFKHVLKSHIKSKHNKTCLKNELRRKQLKEFDYKCETCKYKTNRKSSFENHIKTKHLKEFDYKCETCDYRTNMLINLEYHIKTKHLKEFKYNCEVCQYKTNLKLNLGNHIKTKHLKEFDHECELCQYKTNLKLNLENHIKTKHLQEFKHTCELCKYRSNQKSNLENHIKTKHLKEFDYKCETCDYRTNQMVNLEYHIRTKHLKEFSYDCKMCEYKTNQMSNLDYHIKTKHLKEFKYWCNICQYKTNLKPNLDYHTKTKHLKEFKYMCETCKYRTNQKSNLDYHIKTKHLKEFKYACEMCDYRTNLKPNLECHIKAKHLKEYKYICTNCDYKTNNKLTLEVHIKTEHPKDFDYL